MMRSFSVTDPTLSRIGPSRRMVMVLIIPLIASLVLTGRAAARNEVATDTETGDTITITVNVELAQSNFEEWEKKLDKAFKKCLGDPEGFQTGCKKLFFKLNIVPANPNNEGEKYHVVRIKDVPEGEYEKSSVHSISLDDPTTRDFIGLWDTSDDEATICHEFMHMLGLHDEYVRNLKRGPTGTRFTVPDPNKAPEYTWTDHNGNGSVDWVDRNGNGLVDRGVDDTRELDSVRRKQNERPSILAERVGEDKGWGILPRHITKILEKHRINKCGQLTMADTPKISVFIDSTSRYDRGGEGCYYEHTHKFSTTIEGKTFEWEGKTCGDCARCWYDTNGNGSCPVSCDDLKRGEKVQCKAKTLYGEQTITLPPEPIEEYRRAFCGEERVGQVQPDLHSQGDDRPELLLPASRWTRATSEEAELSAALPACHNVRAEVEDATLR